jgi:hypothetical protein
MTLAAAMSYRSLGAAKVANTVPNLFAEIYGKRS